MSSYRWMIFAVAAAMLGLGAWYFGRPIHPKPNPEEKRVASVTPAQAELPKELPPKVIEVIDLTQAYEPVREPEPVVLGPIDPASFIEEQSAPKRIPYAVDEDNPFADIIRIISEAPTPFLVADAPIVERLDVMPRDVQAEVRRLYFSSARVSSIQLPMTSVVAPEPPSVEIAPVRLDVMPREVQGWFIHGAGINGDAGIVGSIILTNEPEHLEKIAVMPREVK